MKLTNRLNAHFAACAVAAVGAVAVSQQAQAVVVYSGTVNLNIASTTNGLYLNVETGAYNTTGGAGSTVPGWDVNPWSSSTLNFFSSSGGGYVRGNGSSATLTDNLALGYLVDGAAANNYGSGAIETTGATAAVLNGDNYIGFRFVGADTLVHYGWMRISLSSSLTAQPRTLVDYAYESDAGVGILVGATPAPGALALLGVAGLVGSRRRRN